MTSLAISILQEAYNLAGADKSYHSKLFKSIPVNRASELEKENRKWFLDDETAAQVSHDFFMNYALENDFILTQNARRIIAFLHDRYHSKYPAYITELRVPETGRIENHKVLIDLACFFPDIARLKEEAEKIAATGELMPFILSEKGKPWQKYWCLESRANEEYLGKSELTRIKLRQRKNDR